MKVREDKETQNHQLMRKIIEQCQYEVVEKEVYLHSSKEIVKKRNKLDLEKVKRKTGPKHKLALCGANLANVKSLIHRVFKPMKSTVSVSDQH